MLGGQLTKMNQELDTLVRLLMGFPVAGAECTFCSA